MKQLVKAIVPAALLSLSFASFAETSDGKNVSVSAGWAHIMPQGTKEGVQTNSRTPLMASGFNSQAGIELDDADTAEFKFDYLVNDNVSLGLILGVPPKINVDGEGKLLGGALNLDQFDKIGTVKVYSPVIAAKYHFSAVTNKFRPYVGAGMMYAHFSDFKLDGTVANDVAQKGIDIRNVTIKDSIAPVAFVGADYNITPNWFTTASVSYTHLNTEASLDVYSNRAQTTVATAKTKIEINPIVTYVGFGYRF
ncbi:OmpW/AlkL family protein [Acinetobacter sp. HY1485]|uniref:OmpW/AlkL family protein n=1 Tax=Acinetobacter sp. HY1485 TaxID=2970918 RepID=UPI0022B94645|nr:OmpW family outer membrane protein [Acinetobacter sp. HY1485]